jgi:hypothetical protein
MSRSMATNLAIPLAAFAVVALIAQLAGAANLGVALGIGQVAFAATAVWVLLTR